MAQSEASTSKSRLFHPYSRRLHVVLLLMFGFFCASYMRSNLGMTMTCIVNSTAVMIEATQSHLNDSHVVGVLAKTDSLHPGNKSANIVQQCSPKNDSEIVVNDYGGTIVWNQHIQNLLFSGTFVGSFITVLPAGYYADRTSAKNLYLLAIINYSICSALFPLLAYNVSPKIVYLSRVFMGFGEGFIVPAANKLITKWVPNHEKSTAASIFTLGNQIAGGVGIPIVTAFCASSIKWPGVFYFCGLIGLVWCVIWKLVVTNAPEKAKRMTKQERLLLTNQVEKVYSNPIKKQKTIPWVKILTSLPIIACFVSIFGVNMVVVLLQSYQPTFMKEVLYLSLVDNGIYSAAPYIVQIVSKLTWSISIDYLKSTNRLSNTAACKISQCFATFTIGCFLILITHFADCTKPYVVLFMFCAVGIGFSAAISGFYTSLLSLAPAYVGTISSLCQFVGVIGMLVPPYLVSHFRVYGTLEEWQKIFYIVAIYTIASGVFFLIFGRGDTLSWGRGERSDEETEMDCMDAEKETSIQKIEITLEQ